MYRIGFGFFFVFIGVGMILYRQGLMKLTTDYQKSMFGLRFDPANHRWVYPALGVIVLVFGSFILAGKIECDPEKIRLNKCNRMHGVWDPQKKECTQVLLPDN